MWFFWIFGRKIETVIGHLRFALVYLLCGLGGQLFHLLFNLHSTLPVVGASGAISGISGIYFVLFAHDRFYLHLYLGYWRVKTIETVTRSAIGAWIGEQLLLGLLTRVSGYSGVAFWAHVGGFAFGVAAGALYLSRVPAIDRTVVAVIESEDQDNQAQPSDLTTLNLS